MAFTPFKKIKEKRKKRKERRAKYDPSALGSLQMRIDDLAKERGEIKSKGKLNANDKARLKEVQRIINLKSRDMDRYKKKNQTLGNMIK
tara:strand:- start:25447 stop:25713 length:267 start_codon:yes stop_codon:yes gene_type:complete